MTDVKRGTPEEPMHIQEDEGLTSQERSVPCSVCEHVSPKLDASSSHLLICEACRSLGGAQAAHKQRGWEQWSPDTTR